MRKKTALPLLAILLHLTSFSQVNSQNLLKTWDVLEITLVSKTASSNPYLEIAPDKTPFLTARFTGTDGEATGQLITVPGFWDGQNTWKIRFAPPLSGTWNYVTNSADRKMNGKKGQMIVTGWTEEELKANPTRRGFVIVNNKEERKGRYFTYSDGTPFLWIADTWWDWTNRKIKFESFKKLVDTRANQGFNIGQLFFAANGWGRESSLLDAAFQHPDIEQIRNIEKMIRYANSKGITVWIHPWWSREGINKSIGEENIIRWWRYVIHRLHSYNVIWVLAGEYNMNNYGGFPLSFWNEVGSLIKKRTRITGLQEPIPLRQCGAEVQMRLSGQQPKPSTARRGLITTRVRLVMPAGVMNLSQK